MRIDSAANTTVIPTAHASAIHGSLPAGRPLYSARLASVTIVNGLCSAIGRNQLGMFCGDTNAEEMNVSGNIHTKPAEFAASTDFTDRPMSAWIQLNA